MYQKNLLLSGIFFKVTSAKKNFCHLIALNLLIWRKKVLFSRYDEPTYFKICDATQTKLHIRSYNFNCFFIILGSIKIKFAQILMQIMTNISKLFLAVLRRQRTSSKPFYDFDKMVIWYDLISFSKWCYFLLSQCKPSKE